MKKSILSLVLMLCMYLGANAQTRVVYNGPMGIDWKFKRSFMHGTSLVVDFVVENNTRNDVFCQITQSCSSSKGNYVLKAYDDEGNVYPSNVLNPTANKFSGKIGGQNFLFDEETIPQGNLVKVRLLISDIDEYATVIKTLTVPYCSGTSVFDKECSELRVTNIPIPRE